MKQSRRRWAGLALVLACLGIIVMKLRAEYNMADFCGPSMRYDSALNGCVPIEDFLHYTPYADALDAWFVCAVLGVVVGLVAVFRGPDFWPFTVLRAHRYRRAYDAAKAVLLGYYGYKRLEASDQARVDASIDEAWRSAPYNERWDPNAHSYWGWYSNGAFWAVEMANLKIQPPGLPESWGKLLARWQPPLFALHARDPATWAGKWVRAMRLMEAYHVFHPATEAAKADLRGAGFQIPEMDPGWDDKPLEQLTFAEAAKRPVRKRYSRQ